MAEAYTSGSVTDTNYMREDSETSNDTSATMVIFSSPSVKRRHPIFRMTMPSKPAGADAILSTRIRLTLASAVWGNSGNKNAEMHSVPSSLENYFVTGTLPRWLGIDSAGDRNWAVSGGTNGGTTDKIFGDAARIDFGAARGSTFSWNVTGQGMTWDDVKWFWARYTIDTDVYTIAEWWTPKALNSTGYAAADRPRISVRFRDDPPAKVSLKLSADTSLTEATFTFKRRILVSWTASDATDFYRYRIRSGINRTSATNLTTKALVYTRATTSFIDEALYSDGSTVYYTMYVEDGRNTSAGTNALRSDVTGIRTPLVPVLAVTPATKNVLDLITANITVRNDHVGTKVVWGDGSTTFTKTQDSTGSFYTATHRYTRATVVLNIRVQNESSQGIRGAPNFLSNIINAITPIAKIYASPTIQRTGSTFRMGNPVAPSSTLSTGNTLWILTRFPAPADGVGTRARIDLGGGTTGSWAIMLMRPESGGYRVIYYQADSSATGNDVVSRDIQWKIARGDMFGIRAASTAGILRGVSAATGLMLPGITWSSTVFTNVGDFIPSYRFSRNASPLPIQPTSGVKTAFTNPVLFSAKDSFARAANRAINRFRWVPDLRGGTFPTTAASYYNTGATSFFWWGWSTSSYTSMAVRAVDTSHSSSINSAPVFVYTEATFRIPTDLRDPVIHINDKRERMFAHEAIVGADYGVLDIGSIGPRTIDVQGRAYTSSTGSNELIDIIRINDVFRQRKRVFVVTPASAATAIEGYIIDAPFVQSGEAPQEKRWQASVRVVRSS